MFFWSLKALNFFFQISSCVPNATVASYNTQVGYFIDGYPIYGYATNSAGTTLKSCWYSTSTSPSLISQFTYNTTGYTAGTCHLDYANGYTFEDPAKTLSKLLYRNKAMQAKLIVCNLLSLLARFHPAA